MSILHTVTAVMKRSSALAAGGVFALGAGFGQPAHAAGPVAGYVGQAPSSVAGCPYILWRLARSDSGAISGIMYYSDASGSSMVTGTGIGTANGLHLVLKSVQGNGPTGTVTEIKSSSGKMVAKLTGEGCANMEVALTPSPNLNAYKPETGGR